MSDFTLGPSCPACRGISSRAVRTRSIQVDGESIYYLTYAWACVVCGRQWVDGALERLNGWAADAALAARDPQGPVSEGLMGRFST